jgi:serine/threonine protein phosphatase PrpC/CRP-like cAMP-binding protein
MDTHGNRKVHDGLGTTEVLRVDEIEETRTVTCGGLQIRFAYLSQRGYYPDDPNKANQDSYSVSHNFAEQASDSFFAVYDGHGKDGDLCSQFARDHLPTLVEKYVTRAKLREAKQHRPKQEAETAPDAKSMDAIELTKDQIQTACLKAHVECNRAMHRAQHLDDSLSGTTSISLYVHGRRNRITVCNVGDSRAIIGQRQKGGNDNSLKALPLSRDQTPYRRDERERVKLQGARILSLDQIEGLEPINDDDGVGGDLELGEELDEGGDPPRVWSPHGEYPGTAFTRSLGDAIAEELGVFAEPEMLTKEVTSEDRIIVLASDGVFEFLTNQSVIDICAKFNDPLQACRAVVAESYELWLQYELRTDDITMICIFVDDVSAKLQHSGSLTNVRPAEMEKAISAKVVPNGDDTADAVLTTEGLRPVRSHISKEKSRQIQMMKNRMSSERDNNSGEFFAEDFDLSRLYTEKTEQEKARIAEAIRASVMFQNISDEQREMIFGVMEPIPVQKGTWVIKQGTVGDRFYIVDEGKFEVRIIPEGEEDKDGSGGNVVHVYEGSVEKHAHPSFGELALMYSAPRAASIVAVSDGNLWGLHRYAFRQVLAHAQGNRKALMKTLKTVPIFKHLEDDGINKLAAIMEEITFGRGENIIVDSKPGDTMYVIHKGQCGTFSSVVGSIDDLDTSSHLRYCATEYVRVMNGKTEQATLKSGDFFGEEVLVGHDKYNSTVVALQTTNCWKLDKATLKQTLGSMKKKMKSGNNVA